MRFAIFPLHLFKLLRLPRKSDARSCEVLHLSRIIILANLKISCSKMQPFSGNLRPHLLTHLAHVSLLDMLQNPHVLLTWARCRIPCACHAKPHLNLQKWSEHVVNILTWKCAFAPQRRALFQHHNFQKWSQHGVLCTF